MKTYLPLVIGMGLATYIPRLLPMILLTKRELNPKMKRFLQFIPVTSLSILIVRGILTAQGPMFLPTLIGILIAGIVAYMKPNIILSVLTGLVASFLIINSY